MKRKILAVGAAFFLAMFLAVGAYVAIPKRTENPIVAGTSTNLSETVTVKVNDFEKTVDFAAGMTALEATKIAVGGEMVIQGQGADAFVVEILGKGTEKREFWELLVNDQTALVGAGGYKVKAGDKIEWKISKF